MLYVQLYPWATLLKEGKAVAILRAAGGSKGKAETAVECQCWRKSWGSRQSRRHQARLFVPCIASVPSSVSFGDGPKRPVLDLQGAQTNHLCV